MIFLEKIEKLVEEDNVASLKDFLVRLDPHMIKEILMHAGFYHHSTNMKIEFINITFKHQKQPRI
ncbi:MAG: hypothetical protein QXH96_01255 [Candidatus Geothermarchaeota archaeon]